MVISLVHLKKELATFFISGLSTSLTENQNSLQIDFNIGFIQIDNQYENTPAYPVMLKPKDMFFDGKQVQVEV